MLTLALPRLLTRSLHRSLSTSRPLYSSSSDDSNLPSVATSAFLNQTREQALRTPGIIWRDEEVVGVGELGGEPLGTKESDLRAVENGGRETTKMK